MKRKAQFFLLGAIIIALMFTEVHLSQNRTVYRRSNTRFVFSNTKAEWENTIPTIVNEAWTSDHLEDRLYSHARFSDEYMKRRGLNHTSYFIVGLPYSSHMNITVGNSMMEEMINVTVNLSDQGSWSQLASFGNLSHGNISTIRITSVPSFINISYTFDSTERKAVAFNTTKRLFTIFRSKVVETDATFFDIKVS